jgi:hypothetical protein
MTGRSGGSLPLLMRSVFEILFTHGIGKPRHGFFVSASVYSIDSLKQRVGFVR